MLRRKKNNVEEENGKTKTGRVNGSEGRRMRERKNVSWKNTKGESEGDIDVQETRSRRKRKQRRKTIKIGKARIRVKKKGRNKKLLRGVTEKV